MVEICQLRDFHGSAIGTLLKLFPVDRQMHQVVVFERVLIGKGAVAVSTLERSDVEVMSFHVLLQVVLRTEHTSTAFNLAPARFHCIQWFSNKLDEVPATYPP